MTGAAAADGGGSPEDTVVRLLAGSRSSVACAESLTAGLLSGRIASVPGASAVLRGGVVAYATELKTTLLGVPPEVLAREGAVSEACARAMAEGAAFRCGADYGVALTGVAGPDPQEGHPPGTVWIALHGPAGTRSRLLALPGGRAQVREGAVVAALALLRQVLGEATADAWR